MTNSRLFYCGRATTKMCPYRDLEETSEHLYWHRTNPIFANERSLYMPMINKIKGNIAAEYGNPWEYKCFLTAGLLPEDPMLRKLDREPMLNVDKIDCSRNDDYNNYDIEMWEHGYRRVFTDGAQTHPTDLRLGCAACACYYGLNNPFNVASELVGRNISPYRAGLRALLHGLETADVHSWFTFDNLAVVEQAEKICRHDFGRDYGDSNDL